MAVLEGAPVWLNVLRRNGHAPGAGLVAAIDQCMPSRSRFTVTTLPHPIRNPARRGFGVCPSMDLSTLGSTFAFGLKRPGPSFTGKNHQPFFVDLFVP